MDRYKLLEELSADLNGGAKALRVLLEDFHGCVDPDRLHAVIVVADHLLEKAHGLADAVSAGEEP